MEAGAIALIRGQVKTEEGVAVSEVAARFDWKGLERICRPSYTARKLMSLFLV